MHWPKAGVTNEDFNDDDYISAPIPEVFTTKVLEQKELSTEGYLGDE